MKLNFLGCGSAFNPLDGNTSAYFTIGRKLYIVDVGESVFLKLYEKDLLRQYDEILILITHLQIMWEVCHRLFHMCIMCWEKR